MVHKVHIAIVLDRSGSMEEARSEAVDAINTYLRYVREDTSIDARLSIVLFDSHGIDTIRDRVPVATCKDVAIDEYQPRGSTPLLDAVGYSVGIVDCLSDKDERRIMAIVTDGLENASREYTRDRLRGLLERKQTHDGWLVMYLGAGHDSWSQASQLGIAARHTADFSLNAFGEAAEILRSVGSRYLTRAKGRECGAGTGLTSDERLRLISGGKPPRGMPGRRMDDMDGPARCARSGGEG